MDIVVTALRIFPERGQPGVDLVEIDVTADAISGDRVKKAPVSLAGADADAARSNIILSAPNAAVEALAGSAVRIGGVLLALEATGGTCPGLFAAVGEPGVIRIGDQVVPEDV